MCEAAQPGRSLLRVWRFFLGRSDVKLAGDVPSCSPPRSLLWGLEILGGHPLSFGECQSLWGVLPQACGVQECEHRPLPGALLVLKL